MRVGTILSAAALLVAVAGCAPSALDETFNAALDCQDRMERGTPNVLLEKFRSETRVTGERTEVFVTGYYRQGRGKPRGTEYFHCVYNGASLVSNDRRPASTAPLNGPLVPVNTP